MAKVHVFAIDWVPETQDIASGGGLRSRQIIDALREAGHDVSFSIPDVSRHLRRIGYDKSDPGEIRTHGSNDQLDVVRKAKPDIVFWLAPISRRIPFTGSGDLLNVCDLIGLPHIEASMGASALQPSLRQRVAKLCAAADLVMAGSTEQHGYWVAELSRESTPPPTAIVPYALPPALHGQIVSRGSRLIRLHVTGMAYAWSTSATLLQRISDWVGRQNGITLSLIIGTDPGGATDRSVLQVLNTISARPGVTFQGEVSLGRAMADYQPGSVALEVYEPNMERRMAEPIRAINALSHGVPLLSTIDGPFMRRVQAAGAGLIAIDLPDRPFEAALDQLVALPAADLLRMSKAARRVVTSEYGFKETAKSLTLALDQAIQRRRARHTIAMTRPQRGSAVIPTRPPHVLVISDVEAHHRELRIDIPMNALLGEQAIAGYSVWRKGEFQFTTSANLTSQAFDAIWVQRQISPEISIALRILGRPFVYDIDDNILAAPGYRPAFPLEMTQTVRTLLDACTVLTCSTARLAALLHASSIRPLIDKAIVAPNLLREPPPPRPVGAPHCLIWVSSDTPALTASRINVIRAIRDFCLNRDLQLICMGSEPPDLIAASDVRIAHVRQAPYGSYLSMLRSFAPGIMVCPLEIETGSSTADFINGKSDIKMLEVAAGGQVGVFSRAFPYLESDLPRPILCENSYAAWMEALNEAFLRCAQPPENERVPEHRCAAGSGARPWLDAIARARMQAPLTYAEFNHAVKALRGRYGKRLLSQAEFDTAFYLEAYPDVKSAIDLGLVANAYEHYHADGFQEGRLGRRDDTFPPHNEPTWANLLNTLSELQVSVDTQATQLEMLKARRATRTALRRMAVD